MFGNRSCFWKQFFYISTHSIMKGAGVVLIRSRFLEKYLMIVPDKRYILHIKTRSLCIIALHIDKHENYLNFAIEFRFCHLLDRLTIKSQENTPVLPSHLGLVEYEQCCSSAMGWNYKQSFNYDKPLLSLTFTKKVCVGDINL